MSILLLYPFQDNSIFSLPEDGCLWERITRLMTTEMPQHNFLEKGKNATKYARQYASKIPTELMKKSIVSTRSDENLMKTNIKIGSITPITNIQILKMLRQ